MAVSRHVQPWVYDPEDDDQAIERHREFVEPMVKARQQVDPDQIATGFGFVDDGGVSRTRTGEQVVQLLVYRAS
jgi:hypothetical protein